MKNRRGLTLVEVMVSVALIGMVAMIFLNIFTTSNKNIYNSSNKTKEIYELQKAIDEKIINASGEIDGVTAVNQDVEVTIGVNKGLVEGKLITSKNKENPVQGPKIMTFIHGKVN